MTETYWVDGVPHKKLSVEELTEIKTAKKEAKTEKKKRKSDEVPKYIKGKKEGMDLENRVASKWNKGMHKISKNKKSNTKKRLSIEDTEEFVEEALTGIQVSKSFSVEKPKTAMRTGFSDVAKRQPNSGATWHAKGDITLSHALVEVKERGSVNSRGEKTISIPKSWLTKQADEAFQERRPFWYLAFAYKNDDDIYLIKPYDHEIEFVHRLDELEAENTRLKQEIDMLKQNGRDLNGEG